MSFSIKVIDNENGKVIVDEKDAVAIIGVVATEKGCSQIAAVRCNSLVFSQAIDRCRKTLEMLENDNPEVKKKADLLRLIRELEGLEKSLGDLTKPEE